MKKEVKDTIINDLGAKLKEYPQLRLQATCAANASRTTSRWSL